jgi:gluconate 2-dehydrogenase gamma chain
MAISGLEIIPPIKTAQPLSAALNRRDLIRATLLAAAASALGPSFSLAQAIESGLTPAARGQDGAAFLNDANWKPAFLNDQQNETLIVLSEAIIPATDTPGAKQALVNRYIDLLVSVQPTEFQEEFVAALKSIDSQSQTEFGRDFRDLSCEDQISLLIAWAYPQQSSHWTERNDPHTKPADLAQKHFHRLKALIAAAYYGSEIGQKELGWDGEITNGPYQGCEHQSTTHT